MGAERTHDARRPDAGGEPTGAAGRTSRRGRGSFLAILVALTLLAAHTEPVQAAPTLRVLLSFKKTLGENPYGALAADSAGNLYGTTSIGGPDGRGTVFELSPPIAGQKGWARTVLFSFGKRTFGEQPCSELFIDAAGNLYGTAYRGGGHHKGAVFELSPPASNRGPWTAKRLYSFNGADGANPYGGLIADAAGNLYGTAEEGGADGYGAVYELSPPLDGQSAWTEKLLHSFNSNDGAYPFAQLLADGAGNFYGAASQNGPGDAGAIFKLSPPSPGKKDWTDTVIFTFENSAQGIWPWGALIADAKGDLFGTTMLGGPDNAGVVFELTPAKGHDGPWTETILHNFDTTDGENPYAGLVADPSGNLYGTTYFGGAGRGGVVFQLSPPARGKGNWTETVLQNFTLNGTQGSLPQASLIVGHAGELYGTTAEGGAQDLGTVFKITP
jgi:uncharacterized repeat protein (TIGR03803 family)